MYQRKSQNLVKTGHYHQITLVYALKGCYISFSKRLIYINSIIITFPSEFEKIIVLNDRYSFAQLRCDFDEPCL